MMLKRETNIIVMLECCEESRALNSKCKVEEILDHASDHRDGIAQKRQGINNRPKKVESQFKGKFIIAEAGSNTENRLVIIFTVSLE